MNIPILRLAISLTPVFLAAGAFAADAPEVKVEVFSDFQCPYCARFAQPVRDLHTKGIAGVRTKVEFRNFPLISHPEAQLAHQAAVAAGEQGKFWEMHDLIFASQHSLKREQLLEHARKLDLDIARFSKELDSENSKRVIEADKARGQELGVKGTPTFFVDGKEYSGAKSFEELKQLIAGEQLRIRALAEITEDRMSKGPAQALVTMEFFADLQSPVSRPAMAVVLEVLHLYADTVRLQFRNFPLAFHPQAGLAHDAAMIAAKQGRFWELANYLLDHQDSLREQDLIAFAGGLGMDRTHFAQALQEQRYTPRVEADVAEGLKRGIRGSPVIFVNAKKIDGVPSLQMLKESIETELAAKLASAAK